MPLKNYKTTPYSTQEKVSGNFLKNTLSKRNLNSLGNTTHTLTLISIYIYIYIYIYLVFISYEDIYIGTSLFMR